MTDSLRIPFSPHTQLVGQGPRLTQLVAPAGKPGLIFSEPNTHTNQVADFEIRYDELQQNDVPAVLFGGPKIDEMGFYHTQVRNLEIFRAGVAFGLIKGYGKQTAWNMLFDEIKAYNIHTSVFDFNPGESIGIPIVRVKGLTAINTGYGWNKSVGPAFNLNACEFHLDGLDLEGWYGQMWESFGGAAVSFRNLHIEHHHLHKRDGKFGRLLGFHANGGQCVFENASIHGYTNDSEAASLISVDAGGSFRYGSVQTAWIGSEGKPFVLGYNNSKVYCSAPNTRPFGGGFDGVVQHNQVG